MPEDVGGTPFSDGREPDDDHDHGVSDEEFASVVFDEAFVRAATVHEPSAVERLLAAAQARAEASEAEARRAHARGERYDDGYGPDGSGFGQDHDDDELDDTYVLGDGPYGPYGKQVRWHRPVAWFLAVVMGIGMVALAFAAVYRGGSSGTRDRVPAPASTGVGKETASAPAPLDDHRRPAVSAVPPAP
ncbi:SCO2584 family spore wall biosynthesis protein [Streptomyces sp. NPDC017638]|uniref:SCO2584 family spore wall biosynthesis protein n=1 Tax=Streptomyces sp. NPDC017638 TaxID=3365004 RepID=UPI0037B39C3E